MLKQMASTHLHAANYFMNYEFTISKVLTNVSNGRSVTAVGNAAYWQAVGSSVLCEGRWAVL